MAGRKPHKTPTLKTETSAEKTQDKADQKLADAPSPALERAALGDWAKANNPSPQEQIDEAERANAIRRLAQ